MGNIKQKLPTKYKRVLQLRKFLKALVFIFLCLNYNIIRKTSTYIVFTTCQELFSVFFSSSRQMLKMNPEMHVLLLSHFTDEKVEVQRG